MTDEEDIRVVEYTCRHRDILARPLYVDWLATYERCDVCNMERKIIWVEPDE